MNSSETFKAKMSVDIPKDWSIIAIFLFPYIALFALNPLISYCSVCNILDYICFYLSFIALILQDRTDIEVSPDKIAINRFLFGPLVISKKDIFQTETKPNIYHSLRFPAYILIFSLLLFNINNAYNGIHSAIIRDYPTEQLFFLFLSRTLIIVLLCVLFQLMEKRLRFPSILQVTTDYRKYRFYTHEPDEFKKLIDINIEK